MKTQRLNVGQACTVFMQQTPASLADSRTHMQPPKQVEIRYSGLFPSLLSGLSFVSRRGTSALP